MFLKGKFRSLRRLWFEAWEYLHLPLEERIGSRKLLVREIGSVDEGKEEL